MVPAPHFDEMADLARRRPDLELGVHLTLTSESDYVKWGPVGAAGPDTGLVDEDGHFWKTVQDVRERADPGAAEVELRAQIEAALDAGIDVTHLDHHMGAALNPEFAERTIDLGREFGIPVLFPRQIGDYFELLGKGLVDLAFMESLRDELDQRREAVVDSFQMGLETPGTTEHVYRELISNLVPGVTFLSLHCSAPGEIELVHPRNHRRRIEEYELFMNPRFVEWVRSHADLRLTGFRELAA
jgi:predicted glycoside hydrolase/deacetylase ChbG (UPF0249 family)